jgi:hypothetical protein
LQTGRVFERPILKNEKKQLAVDSWFFLWQNKRMKTRYIIYSNYDHQSERKIADYSDKEKALKWWKSCLEDDEVSLIVRTEEKIG